MENGENKKTYSVPISILIAGIIVVVTVFFALKNNDLITERGYSLNNTDFNEGQISIDEDDDYVLGNPDASVIFVNFGDFRCRFCAKFQKDIKPIIIEKYVKTGKVKYVYRDFITMGSDSILPAVGANCAGEQGKYFSFADYLHSGETGHKVVYTNESLLKIAESLGLDKASFQTCLSSGKQIEEIKKDTDDAIKAGATGTPTVFINGRIVSGVNSIEVYEKIIEEELLK